MSLFEDLRTVAAALDPQFQVTSNELPGMVSALALYAEHGDKLTEAATSGGSDAVMKLLTAEPDPEAEPETAAPADETDDDDELARQIADLQARQASRRATAQQTTHTHEPGGA